ncbi:uncharacterized protein isoform X1 [Salmo salar]|uniref:Uncharacterized protein LOC106588746 isoform X1 n=2 Tax=Salmo salar TaxID=8030 RepID=A0A1S3Q0T9_SALSA|nr:uncharacterized protein LOC106588746 isoform X1 [Salmo salar]XP_014033556.1 uncharacterized protein LOC106588746 isoform X1 [Salmo salar]XP_045565766.1 uncharacterized protein LOC106588746 isoform X1 [Salmo salar]XP_045565767.1 uncharacterized protein LOC106588746 isoform X1 [Salmo salar]XP_045565768.1 uncharacterized protein LOC106588746 isoform X1 [Salmo salar]XP_045565769.1 uncharacterized protein LOC106588746 isoform X1 [Salmo salar]XP_045565770.1 uncharacterized protein LOC106588746 i|eukprot:XP_014033549.1 PREDICTED: uncharacterized protein LOC106588746 isoform X1 [Salmo salar]
MQPGGAHNAVCGQSLLSNSLRVYLNNKTRLQPIIGLGCVTECVTLGRDSEAVYLCEVCVCRLSKADVRSHIMGSLHRYNYIKFHHPHFVSEWKQSPPDLSKLARPLMEMAQILEKREGTGDVQVLKLDAAMYDDMTTHSESDALILLHAIRTGREQRDLQSQSVKQSVQSEYLTIESQRTVISPRRLSVQPEKPVVQLDNRTVLWKSPTTQSRNSSSQSEKSPVLQQSVSIQSRLSSWEEEGYLHGSKPLIGASLKRPASSWQHDPSLSPTPNVTAGSQASLGGPEGKGAGLRGVPAKLIRCEPVFKVSLSMTDGPWLLERNSFSLETSPSSLRHASPLHSPTVDASPLHSPTVDASPQPSPAPSHLLGQPGNAHENTHTPGHAHTSTMRLGPAIPDQQLTMGDEDTDRRYLGGEQRFTDYALYYGEKNTTDGHYSVKEQNSTAMVYLRREQNRTDHLYSENNRLTDTKFHVRVGQNNREGSIYPGLACARDITGTASVAGPILFTTGHLSKESLTDTPLMEEEQEEEREKECHSGAQRLAEHDRTTDSLYSTGERITDSGFSTGSRSTDKMFQTGERSTDNQSFTTEVTTDRWYATGEELTDRQLMEEEEQCRAEIQNGVGLIVEVMVEEGERWGGKDGEREENSDFYCQQYLQGQPPQRHQAQGFTGTHRGAVGLHMVDTADLRHDIALHRDQAGPALHREEMSSRMGDMAAMQQVQLCEAEDREAWAYGGTQLTPDTYRSSPQGYETDPGPYLPFPEGHRMNCDPYQVVSDWFRTTPGPHFVHSNPDEFTPQVLPYPHNTQPQGIGPHPHSGPFPMKMGGVQPQEYRRLPSPPFSYGV